MNTSSLSNDSFDKRYSSLWRTYCEAASRRKKIEARTA